MTPRESVVRFGPAGSNVGILTAPAPAPGSASAARGVGVVLLNPGMMHRIGNGRLHVRMARALAADGYPVLRFDSSGLGDSPRRPGVARTMASAVEEVHAAVALLCERAEVSRVVLYGLCGGADVAQSAAVSCPAVAGLALVDPWVFRTPAYWAHRVWQLATRPRKLAASVAWHLTHGRRATPEDAARHVPPRDAVARDLKALMARGTALWVCFTGGYRDRYAYQGQYRAAFHDVSFGAMLEKDWLRSADHLVSSPDAQQQVLEGVAALAHRVATAPGSLAAWTAASGTSPLLATTVAAAPLARSSA
jgi:pimeloyl-ACP methyl ester carboxylesterase